MVSEWHKKVEKAIEEALKRHKFKAAKHTFYPLGNANGDNPWKYVPDIATKTNKGWFVWEVEKARNPKTIEDLVFPYLFENSEEIRQVNIIYSQVVDSKKDVWSQKRGEKRTEDTKKLALKINKEISKKEAYALHVTSIGKDITANNELERFVESAVKDAEPSEDS